jgi:hypothetical protein
MKVVEDRSWRTFQNMPNRPWWNGLRVKSLRHETLNPGGRAELTLFARPDGEDRSHPRMQWSMPPAEDRGADTVPAPAASLGAAENATGFRLALAAHLGSEAVQAAFAGQDLDSALAPEYSPHYWRNSIRAQRVAKYFEGARAMVAAGPLTGADRADAMYTLASKEDEAYAGENHYDDYNTGTYHSFGHDAPFVHYLETMLASLPEEETEDWAALDAGGQEAVRRQREQAQNHLDYLMRHKYAFHGIEERDIEKSLGGFLVDRDTRHIVSETPESADGLAPEYELLRIDPVGGHEHAGAWVHRVGDDLRLEDGFATVEVDEALLVRVEVEAADLTFKRAPDDEHLRPGIRFDWDGNGWVQRDKIDWIGWAGHCDIKAIIESLGCTLEDDERVRELCAETGRVTVYDNDAILEMLASVMELGSLYARLDGGGRKMLGKHLFGGARNDSRPDRLQFEGEGTGKHFRWPLGGRRDAFTIGVVERDGEVVDLNYAFFRYLPNEGETTFADNPSFLKIVEGDYSLIDVAGTRLEARVKIDSIDPETGYPTTESETLTIDLRPEAETKRHYLGTYLYDAGKRLIYRFYLETGDAPRIVGALDRHELRDGQWVAVEDDAEAYTLSLKPAGTATLSREMKRDQPEAFQTLLDVALRAAQNICADTDQESEVWNGAVSAVDARKRGENREARTEHWSYRIKARFGTATLEYLMRRSEDGEPEAYCPVKGESDWQRQPDFLWQDFPDVGSKAQVDGHWVVNESMIDRDIVYARHARWAGGETYVLDDYIKHVFELLFCALSGRHWTVLHANRRYAFGSKKAWKRARRNVRAGRSRLSFQPPRGSESADSAEA